MSALDILEKLKLQEIEARTLVPLQRVLIVTDGTLTEILEATFLERIRLVKLSQQIISITCAQLEAGPEESLLERKILLQGEKSNKNYVYAKSVIAISRLPAAFHDALIHSDISLGRLWLEYRLETFKELLDVRQENAGEHKEFFKYQSDDSLLVRTYRVYSAARPVMIISEYFPKT